MDRSFVNIILLGIAFFLIFTAFQTGSMIQKTVTDSINQDYGLHWSGYASLCILYFVFSFANFIAPVIVAKIGPKITMVIGALTYVLFISNFLYPFAAGLYIVSVIIGFGAAIIWTAQGNFLTINSKPETMARNSGIFWALLQCSLLFGNLFVFFMFKGETRITPSTRTIVYSVLTGVGILGTFMLFTLRTFKDEQAENAVVTVNTKETFMKSFQLLKTKTMLLLCLTFFYTGLELSFFSGVYGTAIGATKALGSDSQKFIGISGMLIGVGEITGGLVFGILGSRTTKHGRDPIVILGYVVHMISYVLVFFNLPNRASIADTYDSAFISSSIIIALLCSFLLGLGDSCFNTQIYSILGSIYASDSSPAFAMFKFVQSTASALAFFYSSKVGLHVHVVILAITGTIGTISFCLVEWAVFKKAAQEKIEKASSQEPSTVISEHSTEHSRHTQKESI